MRVIQPVPCKECFGGAKMAANFGLQTAEKAVLAYRKQKQSWQCF